MASFGGLVDQVCQSGDFPIDLVNSLLANLTDDTNEMTSTDQLALNKLVKFLANRLYDANLSVGERQNLLTLIGASLYGRSRYLDGNMSVSHLIHPHNGILRGFLTSGNDRTVLLTLKCLRNITLKISLRELSENDNLMPFCMEFLLSSAQNLLNYLQSSEKHKVLQCVLPALIGIENLLLGGMKIQNMTELGSILGLCKAFIGCGLPGFSICLPMVLNSDGRDTVKLPSVLPNCGATATKSVTQKRKPKLNQATRRQLKSDAAANNSTASQEQSDSDAEGISPTRSPLKATKSPTRRNMTSSDASDQSDSFDPQQKLRFLQGSIKTAALSILQLITKATQKKNLYGFWGEMVGENQQGVCSYDFLTVLMKESSFRIRSAALNGLSAWISACRQFLLLAETSEKTVAFTPLSASIANSISEVVKSLLLAMMAEHYNAVLTQLLKTVANLGCSCNLDKVEVGLAAKISLSVRPYLFHFDTDVRVSALTCLGVLVASKVSDGEVQKILQVGDTKNINEQLSTLDLADSSFPPLIAFCVELSVNNAVPLPVRLEAMQLISATFKAHPALMRRHYEVSLQFCLTMLTKEPYDVKLHGLMILQVLFSSLSRSTTTSFEADATLDSSILLDMWQNHILKSPEFQLFFNLQRRVSVEPILTAGVCETLACLKNQTFESLSTETKTLVITVFSGLLQTEDIRIQTGVLKCTKTICTYRCITEHLDTLSNLVNFLAKCVDSSSVAVLESLSDAFIAVTDCLVDHSCSDDKIVLQQSLMSSLVSSCQKSVRLRPGAVLSLGKFLGNPTFVSRQQRHEVQFAVEQIVQNLTNPNTTVKCHASMASGLIFSNRQFVVDHSGDVKWLLDTLLTVLSQKDNWKLCRLIVESLGKLVMKPVGFEFSRLLQMLFELLDITKMENLTFDNYRLIESLQDSTIRSLLKLICLSDRRDLAAVEREFLHSHVKPFSYACDRYKSVIFANIPVETTSSAVNGDVTILFSALDQLRTMSELPIVTQLLAILSEGL